MKNRRPSSAWPNGSRIKLLKQALKHGGTVDASGMVLNGDSQPRLSDGKSGVHRPPFLTAAFQYESFGEEQEAEDGQLKRQGVRDFERLSVAARRRLGLKPEQVEAETERAKAMGVHLDNFFRIDPRDILEALAWVADELGPDQGVQGSARTAEQLAMRGGLQLIGCHITASGDYLDGLRLVNARQPISLRLIGCVVDCPLLLAHCQLVSLDLSGSALNALDATGLLASGSVHLRRTVVRTPVSFAGAHVGGSFNASDAVMAPFRQIPGQVPVNPDNGMLNLSRATVENEVRLNRARIWGGLSLRGARVGRSLFLTDAILVSPLAMLEKWMVDTLEIRSPEDDPVGAMTDQLARADMHAADRAHDLNTPEGPVVEHPNTICTEARPGETSSWTTWTGVLREYEILEGDTHRWQNLADRTLKRLSARALATALRADGLQVSGSVFARAMICNGLMRMKYAVLDNSLRMEGGVFRCAADIRRSLEVGLKPDRAASPESRALVAGMRKAFDDLFSREDKANDWRGENTDVAVDLRETRLKGDLTFGSDRPPAGQPSEDFGRLTRWSRTHVIGNMRFQGVEVSGSIKLNNAKLIRSPNQQSPALPSAPDSRSGGDAYKAMFERDRSAGSRHRLADGRLRRACERLANAVSMPHRWAVQGERRGALRDELRRAGSDFSRPMLGLSQVTIGRDLDLRNCEGINGLSLENSTIGGDLQFAGKSSGRLRPESEAGFIQCRDRAVDVSGTIDLRAVEIAGDAFLVFDARTGPIIKAGMARVGGRLDIYPQIGSKNYQVNVPKPEGFWLDSCSHEGDLRTEGGPETAPGYYCKRCNVMLDKVEDHLTWFIDLRQARATVFSHPPVAWPDPGGLSLDGFSYQQTSDLGPLAPKPPLVEEERVHYEAARLRFVWRNAPWWRTRATFAILIALAACILTATYALWSLTQPMGWRWIVAQLLGSLLMIPVISGIGRRAWPSWVSAIFAVICLSLLQISLRFVVIAPALSALMAIMLSVWLVWRGLLWMPPGERAWRLGQSRAANRSAPRALEYLARQRVSASRFKLRPSGYHVLDSYVYAARALREAGRYVSANMVEEERLRRRTQMMSWRHHGAAKLVLTLVDMFAGYGFRLSRAVTVICLFICATAALAHWSAAVDYLAPIPPEAASTLHDPQTSSAPSRTNDLENERRRVLGSAAVHPDRPKAPALLPTVPPGKCGSSHDASSLNQDCPDLIYATDLLLPFIDLGEEKRWKPQIPERDWSALNGLWEPFRSLWVSLLRSWPALINMIGLFLSAIMATAVAARVESAFARVEE